MTITYAGVHLTQTNPELIRDIEQRISTRDVYEFERRHWPGRNLLGMAFPGTLPERPIKLNSLFWPRGASRWAVGHFLATDGQLDQIRAQVYLSQGYAAQPLVMTQVHHLGQEPDSITTNLWMLPPRPLFQILDQPGPTFPGLYLLTLVDDRYFWWHKHTDEIDIPATIDTWTELLAHLEDRLGITITADAIPSAYLEPGECWNMDHEYVPPVLDSLAYNVGMRIVRDLDGTVRMMNVANSRARNEANLAAYTNLLAGGKFSFVPAAANNDLPPVLPESIVVACRTSSGGPHAVEVLLADLTVNGLESVTGHDGTKHFKDTAIYSGSNGTELDALAEQFAMDWYAHQVGNLDYHLVGIANWEPEGLHDSIEWTLRNDLVSTRIQRPAWNDLTEELQHSGSAGAFCEAVAEGGDGSFLAVLTAKEYDGTTPVYSWTRVLDDNTPPPPLTYSDGTEVPTSGTPESFPAYSEMNRDLVVCDPEDDPDPSCVVRLRKGVGDYYLFDQLPAFELVRKTGTFDGTTGLEIGYVRLWDQDAQDWFDAYQVLIREAE